MDCVDVLVLGLSLFVVVKVLKTKLVCTRRLVLVLTTVLRTVNGEVITE